MQSSKAPSNAVPNAPAESLPGAPPEILKEVIEIIVNAVNLHSLEPDSINAATSLRDGGLELDSIDILEVVVAIEHHFKIKVGDAEVAREHFRTIGKIANYVQFLKSAS